MVIYGRKFRPVSFKLESSLRREQEAMIDAGYMAKKISPKPDWIEAPGVVDICSVSYCISEAFCDYIQHWKHNGYWFFDSPSIIREIAGAES